MKVSNTFGAVGLALAAGWIAIAFFEWAGANVAPWLYTTMKGFLAFYLVGILIVFFFVGLHDLAAFTARRN